VTALYLCKEDASTIVNVIGRVSRALQAAGHRFESGSAHSSDPDAGSYGESSSTVNDEAAVGAAADHTHGHPSRASVSNV
jgi:hypothetical protein